MSLLYKSDIKSLFLSHLSHLSSPTAARQAAPAAGVAGRDGAQALWGGCSSPKWPVRGLEGRKKKKKVKGKMRQDTLRARKKKQDKRRDDKTGHGRKVPLPPSLEMLRCVSGSDCKYHQQLRTKPSGSSPSAFTPIALKGQFLVLGHGSPPTPTHPSCQA